ncbi:MAG: rRNA maturation RNase YbeY [Bacteroidia bacterium]|nr:rRNA maturation RNase YbeY [Bacteroidia bacterium]HQV01409.1 rRNA maturation RNase YbeY [Bacteroidia bacterium]
MQLITKDINNIALHKADVSTACKNIRFTKQWLANAAKAEGYAIESLQYIFCSDKYLLAINKKFLNHHNYTDIITFEYNVEKNVIADIYISIDTVRTNAKRFNVTVADELHRVMIHGLLHVTGYNDKTTALKQTMTARENHYLKKRRWIIQKQTN